MLYCTTFQQPYHLRRDAGFSAVTDTISSPTVSIFFQPPASAQVGGLILAPQPRHSELWATSQPRPQPGSAAGSSGEAMGMCWGGDEDGMGMG